MPLPQYETDGRERSRERASPVRASSSNSPSVIPNRPLPNLVWGRAPSSVLIQSPDESAASDQTAPRNAFAAPHELQLPHRPAAASKNIEESTAQAVISPRDEQIEKQLYGEGTHATPGIHLNALTAVHVFQTGVAKVNPISDFTSVGLHPIVAENAVTFCGYHEPTPIQAYICHPILAGIDIIASAQTGSGKTAAYLIPLISRILTNYPQCLADKEQRIGERMARTMPLALIIIPTRELALQIHNEVRRLTYRTVIRSCIAYGGAPRVQQLIELGRGCDILIGTPGRLADFVKNESHRLSLKNVICTVFDEADELIQTDWTEDLNPLVHDATAPMRPDHSFAFVSATFDPAARKKAREFMSPAAARIRIARKAASGSNIHQQVMWCDEDKKHIALMDILRSLPMTRTLVFTNSKSNAARVDAMLHSMGFPSTLITSEISQREREAAIDTFSKGDNLVLVATGLAARGLDIPNVYHVVNYDLPSVEYGGINEYINRVGRTGRIGNQGFSTSLFNDSNIDISQHLYTTLIENGSVPPDWLHGDASIDHEYKFAERSDSEPESATEVPPGENPSATAEATKGTHTEVDNSIIEHEASSTPSSSHGLHPERSASSGLPAQSYKGAVYAARDVAISGRAPGTSSLTKGFGDSDNAKNSAVEW